MYVIICIKIILLCTMYFWGLRIKMYLIKTDLNPIWYQTTICIFVKENCADKFNRKQSRENQKLYEANANE